MRNYATQMDAAKRGIVTPEIETVAKKENRPVEFIMERVAKGTIAIPANINHKSLSAEAVGDGTRVKINVNLGISGDCKDYEMELRKVRMAVDMGAESIMDLSNYGKTNTFRKQLIDMSPAMIGTVPMYDAIGYLEKELADIKAEDFLKVLEAHAKEGVDFMTIHAGINRRAVEAFMREGRRMNIVSRGGSLLFAWMKMTGNENPFFEYYDEVLDILRRYDVTISLGDALRPGCIDDASDAGQISELIELGNLAQRAWAKDVQVMIEGPGHMAMNEIAANMQMEKRLCHGAPFYVLGPLVTDIAPGYDHITSAIGGAIDWIFAPLGWGNWQAVVASITGLVAKENIVGTLGVLYGGGDGSVYDAMAAAFTGITAYSFLVFNLLCAPCFAAIGAIKREMNSRKWTWFAIGYQCVFAYVIALMINQFGALFTGNANILGVIVAVLLLAGIIYMLCKPYKEATKLSVK